MPAETFVLLARPLSAAHPPWRQQRESASFEDLFAASERFERAMRAAGRPHETQIVARSSMRAEGARRC